MRSKNQEGLRLALIAHDNKKVDLIAFVHKNADQFANFRLLATQATGKVIRDKLNLEVKCFLPGPLGGDLQIGGELASGRIDALIFSGIHSWRSRTSRISPHCFGSAMCTISPWRPISLPPRSSSGHSVLEWGRLRHDYRSSLSRSRPRGSLRSRGNSPVRGGALR